jgi:bacteriorhodopsin
MNLDHSDITSSSIIGVIMGFIFNILIPLASAKDKFIDWGVHTIGAIATAVIVSFFVYKFQRFLKRMDENKTKKDDDKRNSTP